jgi:hypothetical protein
MIFKKISPKISAEKLAFLAQNKAKLWKILIITLVFEKNANFFAENGRKSQKIKIITSTPGQLFVPYWFVCKPFISVYVIKNDQVLYVPTYVDDITETYAMYDH